MEPSSAMKELHKMVATSAIHDGKRDKEDYTDVCHPGTREEYLANLQAWADNAPPDTRVEWVNAIAGAGKTAMMRTFCTLLEERGPPPFSFFVWKGDAKRNTLEHFPATIAYQLCQTFPVLIPFIEKAINTAPLLLQSAFKKQMDKLVIGPLLEACDTIKAERHLIIVVDGLDELDAKGQTELLNFIPYVLSQLSSLPVSLLVSSRPDDQIVGAFNHPKLASITRATRLGASDADIRKFLEDKFEDINLRYPYLRIEHGVGGKWPGDEKLAIMVKQSSGLFIWPTVAIGHIDKVEKGLGHNARLDQVLSSAEPKPWVGSPLDKLYRAILEAHAPEDRTSYAFYRFKRRLALLCILDLGTFVRVSGSRVLDWSDAPVRAIFDETLDELWGSVAGLSSLFSSRQPPSNEESPTPDNLHRSLRDFTFNRERCGEELYYSSEEELHAEIVCKFIKFFNTPQAYLSCTGMSAKFISRAGKFLQPHLENAAASEGLGHCMDDILLDYIPRSWPLVAQMFAIVQLLGGLYELAKRPGFPEGLRRREALLSKVALFIKVRTGNAQELDTALFQLALSTADFIDYDLNEHSTHCWCIASSSQCACTDAHMRSVRLDRYQGALCHSLFQDTGSRPVAHRHLDIAQDCLYVLQFFLSLSKTGPCPANLSPFIRLNDDYWIIVLLKHCPPNNLLYNTLEPLCTVPLPDLPEGEAQIAFSNLVAQVLQQTEDFEAYAERCQEAGIETNFLPAKIPDKWWKHYRTRTNLLHFKYKPPFDIPDDWWQDAHVRVALLKQGYKPSFNIPDEWWDIEPTRDALLAQGFEPPLDIPEHWWHSTEARRILRSRGYPVPDACRALDGITDDEVQAEPPAVQDVGTDQRVAQQGEQSADAEALSAITSPLSTPVTALSNPLHVHPVGQGHPTTTPIVGAENGQVAPSNAVAGRRRRGIRDSLKTIFRR